jgi:hypothetical protein
VSGKKDANGNLTASMIQGVDFHLFPLDNPGIVSIPLSFLLGYLGTVLGEGEGRPGPLRGDGGALADRRRIGEGHRALTDGVLPGGQVFLPTRYALQAAPMTVAVEPGRHSARTTEQQTPSTARRPS